MIEAGGQRDLMAEVAREPNHLDAGITVVQLAHNLVRSVDGSVVDEDDFARSVEG
jgi:hypothetical protein